MRRQFLRISSLLAVVLSASLSFRPACGQEKLYVSYYKDRFCQVLDYIEIYPQVCLPYGISSSHLYNCSADQSYVTHTLYAIENATCGKQTMALNWNTNVCLSGNHIPPAQYCCGRQCSSIPTTTTQKPVTISTTAFSSSSTPSTNASTPSGSSSVQVIANLFNSSNCAGEVVRKKEYSTGMMLPWSDGWHTQFDCSTDGSEITVNQYWSGFGETRTRMYLLQSAQCNANGGDSSFTYTCSNQKKNTSGGMSNGPKTVIITTISAMAITLAWRLALLV